MLAVRRIYEQTIHASDCKLVAKEQITQGEEIKIYDKMIN
jgi:hypothetical protein